MRMSILFVLAVATTLGSGLELHANTTGDSAEDLAAADTLSLDSAEDLDAAGTLSSDSAEDVAAVDTLSVDSTEDLDAADTLSSDSAEEIKPETGDKIPPYAKSFAGCACDWLEPRGYWACEGKIAFPEEIQGRDCGCCGVKCLKSNRKSDEECLAGGYDQKAELEAERKRLEELLKGADLLIGTDLPGFIVTLPDKGQCTTTLIKKACTAGNGKAKDLTPLCDHTSYSSTNQCYTPGTYSGSKYWHKHFSHWSSHRQLMNLDVDDEIFYGMCFFTSNGVNTLTPSGNGHTWTNSAHSHISKRPGLHKPKNSVRISAMNDGTGELGSWRTICVKQAPNKAKVQR